MTPPTAATALPPVTPEVASAALDALPARLRKRVDGVVAKAAAWPVVPAPGGAEGTNGTENSVAVRVDDDTVVILKVTAGIVVTPDDVTCTCLLAPACLHRAAVLSLAPPAEDTPLMEPKAPAEAEAPAAAAPVAGPAGAAGTAGTAEAVGTAGVADAAGAAGSAGPGGAVLSSAQERAVRALRDVATGLLVAGVAGAGAAHRARLLHAAHSARVAGLHRASATAVRIARRVGEARSGDPAFRLSDLASDLAGLLAAVSRPDTTLTAPARRSYRPGGPLRLYGLFTEPVVTTSGYAGATTYAMAPDGTLHTLSDVAPGRPDRAVQAAGSPVPGGCALPLRELGDGGGVILTEPSVAPDGRIGGGSKVRSVRAKGAQWHEAPLEALWERAPADQLADVLDWSDTSADARPAGGDLLFLTGRITGRSDGFAVHGGPLLRLLAPDERPELPYAENLRLLASYAGLPLRVVARVVPGRPGAVAVLAAAWAGHGGAPVRVDLGLRHVNRSHLPGPAPQPQSPAGPGDPGDPADPTDPTGPGAALPALPTELELLRRTVERTVAGGRPVAAAADGELPRRLRQVGLSTGAQCARSLTATAADRRHDPLGRLLPADPEAFAAAWLAASVYASAAGRSMLLAAWSPARTPPPVREDQYIRTST